MNKLRSWAKVNSPYLIVGALLLILAIILLWSRILVVIKPGEAGAPEVRHASLSAPG